MYLQFCKKDVQPELVDVLEEFPKIFLEPSTEVSNYYEKYGKDLFPRSELCNLRSGFEHGVGWKEILRGFCREIQDLCDKAAANGDKFQYKGFIIKEKFGEFTPQGDVDCDKEFWLDFIYIKLSHIFKVVRGYG